MFIAYEEFVRRADAVRARIGEACAGAGRPASDVELLAVTKNHPAEAAEYAARYGLRAVGENRVQEGVEKRARAAAPIRWELIGHLQSNKVGLAVQNFDRIQSVDSLRLLKRLDAAAARLGKVLPVLLEINVGGDPAKFGASPAEAAPLLEAALAGQNLRVEGLMTIAPLSGDPGFVRLTSPRRAFDDLRLLRDGLARSFGVPLRELSMGMSADLGEAVAAGSTLVRIGTALFGERPHP
jgi:pyridoxal phosphate enzyme (YggS family)